MNYRQYPRLREQAMSLMFQIDGAQGPPTAAQMTRITEIRTDLDRASARLDAVVSGPIADINRALQGRPRIGDRAATSISMR
jgi:hypothetical protein